MVWGRLVLHGRTGAVVASWMLCGTDAPDLAVVDALARLQLAARRAGWSIRLRDVGRDLAGLLDLAGLRREMGGEPEGGEEALRVEEGVEPGDPVA